MGHATHKPNDIQKKMQHVQLIHKFDRLNASSNLWVNFYTSGRRII
jgi:hypothetical protein